MTIKYLLILVFVCGLIISTFLFNKHLRGKEIVEKSLPITSYQIVDVRCSFSYKMSSNIDVLVDGEKYNVEVPSNICKKIENNNQSIRLFRDGDEIFLEGYYMSLTYVFLAFVISSLVTLLGFIVYRKELNNHYKTI